MKNAVELKSVRGIWGHSDLTDLHEANLLDRTPKSDKGKIEDSKKCLLIGLTEIHIYALYASWHNKVLRFWLQNGIFYQCL